MGTCFSYGNKSIQKTAEKLNNIKKIVIIGSGTMGVGIGIDLLNKTGYQITFVDISDDSLKKARNAIKNYFTGMVKAGRLFEGHLKDLLGRVKYSRNFNVLKGAEIIWEVATERLEIKKSIFANIEKVADPEALMFVFSNTSSHTTTELAELFSDAFLREKFLTGHGYFPFHANRLFDVMKGEYASEQTFQAGIAFAEQVLEKKVIALRKDHHGYVADPIFEGMAAIISWDVKTGQDLVEFPQVFEMLTANPFMVLDRTGHMPYTECAKHMGDELPAHDRLKAVYDQNKRRYPKWIEDLEKSRRTGINSPEKSGFFKWNGPLNREKPIAVYNPATKKYIPLSPVDKEKYWSISEAKAMDHRNNTIKSIDGLIGIAKSEDHGGKTFRRYVIPFMLYALDLIQDGYCTAADVNVSTKVGLRFKFGLCEIIDGFLDHFGIDGFLDMARKTATENPDRKGFYDVDGLSGPRTGKPSLLLVMKKKGWTHLLGYGRVYRTPVSQRNIVTGGMDPYYNDLRFVYPSDRDRVATVIFDNPLRGNVWNKYTLDQFDHALGVCMELYQKGKLGGILFTASGTGMRMLGADTRQFNKGWFDPKKGYSFLGEEEASYFTKAGMKLFRFIQKCPVWTAGVFGEKWGGGAEFTYFLNLRFDLILHGVEFDTLKRQQVYKEKNNYNQPEIEYAILGGFGAVQELRRLGFGDSVTDELFLNGLTARRAFQLGLSNYISDSESELLSKAYELLRLKQKNAAPYSMALYNLQKNDAYREGVDDERLTKQTGETFNPAKNPYVSTGLLRLLNMGGKNPPPDLTPRGDLPGWKNNYDQLFDE